jgi:hypothetical protein
LTYRFVNEEQKKEIWPKRVQILIDDHLKAGRLVNDNIRMEYQFQTIDYHEKIFDDITRQKPESSKILVTSMYRVKTLQNEEFYFYAATKTCNNALNQPAEPFSYEYYGYHKSPVVTMAWNETKGTSEPKVTGYLQGYELPWNKDEVQKLLKSSTIPCQEFYIGKAGTNSNEPIEDHRYKIYNMKDFVNGSFEDLYTLGRLGISKEDESLYLLESAKRDDAEARKQDAARRMK